MTTKTKRPASKGRQKPEQKNRQVPMLLIGFGVVAALLIAAIVLSSEEPIGSAGEFGEPSITGGFLPPTSGNTTSDPAVGMVAPEIEGVDFDGNAVSVSHDGNPKAVVFLAHWCPHCQDEVPRVQGWLDSGGGVDGVDIVAVSTFATSGRDNWPPSRWLESENWTTPTIADDSDSNAMVAYGGTAVPYWVFLNGDGTVAGRISGGLEIGTLEQALREIQAAG